MPSRPGPAVLLATCADLPAGDEDAPALQAALQTYGVDARWTAWTDEHADWSDALVVLRSTWDYADDRPRFVDWVTGLPRVANAADVVVWNTDKTYLADVAAAGVPTVPSSFAPPGTPLELPDGGEIVIKPSVGAGSRGAGRFVLDTATGVTAARAHAATLQAAGRTVVVQPYLGDVERRGETSLMYLDGRYSHAIRKGPMLPDGVVHPLAGRELFVEEAITRREPEPAESAVGAAAAAFVRERFGDQLYLRVDLLWSPDGPLVTELELTEPSLFLGQDPHAADRLAAAIAART